MCAANLELLADLEDLGAAVRAETLGCGTTVLHDDVLGVLDVLLGLALHAVTFLGCHSRQHLLILRRCADRDSPRRADPLLKRRAVGAFQHRVYTLLAVREA